MDSCLLYFPELGWDAKKECFIPGLAVKLEVQRAKGPYLWIVP